MLDVEARIAQRAVRCSKIERSCTARTAGSARDCIIASKLTSEISVLRTSQNCVSSMSHDVKGHVTAWGPRTEHLQLGAGRHKGKNSSI